LGFYFYTNKIVYRGHRKKLHISLSHVLLGSVDRNVLSDENVFIFGGDKSQ
jgi:hypothetical protein